MLLVVLNVNDFSYSDALIRQPGERGYHKNSSVKVELTVKKCNL